MSRRARPSAKHKPTPASAIVDLAGLAWQTSAMPRYPDNLQTQAADKNLRGEIQILIAAGGASPVTFFTLDKDSIIDPGGSVMFETRLDLYQTSDTSKRLGGISWHQALCRSGAWNLMGDLSQAFAGQAGIPLQNVSFDVTVDGSGNLLFQLFNPDGTDISGTVFIIADKLVTTHEGSLSLPEPVLP